MPDTITRQPEKAQRPETKGEATRRAVLEAAIARFGRDGFRATSVADIARDAGVGGTVAYSYFPGKEALFLAAVDHDAADAISEGLAAIRSYDHAGLSAVARVVEGGGDWRQSLVFTLVAAVEQRPLARRVLGGQEPDVIERILEIPALQELRAACGERLAAEQLRGEVRSDVDPAAMGNGVVSIVLSLLMSIVQLGSGIAAPYAADVSAVFRAALEPVSPGAVSDRRR